MFITRNVTLFNIVTALIFVVALGIIFTIGLRPSIDFTGGSLTEVSYDTIPEKGVIETALTEAGYSGFSLRESSDESGRGGYILRSKDLSESERIEVTELLVNAGEGGSINRFTTVGPVIGEELKSKALWAIGAVALVIVLYVAFAFRGLKKPVSSWVYGGITILSLLHDVLVPTALMCVMGLLVGAEIDVLFIMAILAVLGYSVNDTIVVFDRVRENLLENETKKNPTPFKELVGRSIEQSLLRSLNTSGTTLITLCALYVLGGEVTKYFALVLIAGVIAGTYSSIFMTNPLLIAYAEWQDKKKQPA
jgi:preprotein translocase subunit SecF